MRLSMHHGYYPAPYCLEGVTQLPLISPTFSVINSLPRQYWEARRWSVPLNTGPVPCGFQTDSKSQCPFKISSPRRNVTPLFGAERGEKRLNLGRAHCFICLHWVTQNSERARPRGQVSWKGVGAGGLFSSCKANNFVVGGTCQTMQIPGFGCWAE